MNASQETTMSPNTFRRLLAAHGRTTTPGVFEASVTYNPDDIMKELIEKKRNDMDSKARLGGAGKRKPRVFNSEHEVARYVMENVCPPKRSLINPPLSKTKSAKPILTSSYSFYTRPFKVRGREAWEFAMRGLGSVDTLLNRYGYVEPTWRGEIHPAPIEMKHKSMAARAEKMANNVGSNDAK